LEPLGYVEKADGRVEAIISLGEHVQVVHEGEILEDKFRVAKLSSSSVELVENSATAAEAPLKAEVGQGLGPAPTAKADRANFPPNPEQVSNSGTERQFSSASAPDSSQASLRRDLGYVERADGRVEAIVAEGDHVRLAQATKAFASDFRAPAPSAANVELANASAPAVSPQDAVALESQPRQVASFDQEAEGPPLIALGPEAHASDQPEAVSAGQGESGPEPLGIVQPEALADYSGRRFGANIPETPAPTLPIVEPTTPSDGSGKQSVVMLGYVEKAGGEREGIVEVLGQVYLVHEGELFAEKYRVMLVTPSTVQIVEELTKGSSELAEPKRDLEPARPPVSRWRAPPLFLGSSGTDPPVEADKTGELAAGERASTSGSPPERSVGSYEKPEGLQILWTRGESVRPAGQLAQTDRCSLASAFNTVGFVEKASGEMQAIVADEGGVYLVPTGKVAGIQNCEFRRESGIVAQGRDNP
jgi:Tfp pilus assembly protein PilP